MRGTQKKKSVLLTNLEVAQNKAPDFFIHATTNQPLFSSYISY